jgi:thermospermine synthase
MDLDDPLEGGPCYQLYTKTFYEMAKTKLNPGGIFITQSAAVGPRAYQRVFSPVHNTLKHVFPKVFPYARAIYSFADEWGYNMAFTDEKMALPSPAEIDERIASRIDGELRYLDGCSFSGIFCLSKEVRKFLAEEKRILSVDQPAFFYGKIN